MRQPLKFLLIFLTVIVIVILCYIQKGNQTNQTLNLSKLSDEEIVKYAMKDNRFKNFEV